MDSIVKRFKTGAMSYGSISQEAHECLAEAMNRLGESPTPARGRAPGAAGDGQKLRHQAGGLRTVWRHQRVPGFRRGNSNQNGPGRQAWRGRPPARGKVVPVDRQDKIFHSGRVPDLPPPHHDIYSIEDLGPTDLRPEKRQPAGPHLRKAGKRGRVGTIAAGVAKAGAQVVLISGYDGGTGAAPRSSIHNAGLPWELGLAEAHQALIDNDLRSRVRLETDGKLMSGRDVAIACYAGAEEFGFATRPGHHGLRDDAGVQSGHLPGGRRHPESRAAKRFCRKAGARGELHALYGAGAAGDHGQAGRAHVWTSWWAAPIC